MATVVVKHRVRDYADWRRAFDAYLQSRKAGGEKAYQILHPADEPNNLTVIFEWDSAENVQAFLEGRKLKEAMREAGVIEAPDISILEEIDRGMTQ